MNKEQNIDEFIRDVTSVVPLSKSEVKGRLDEIILQEREKIIEIIDKIEGNYFSSTRKQGGELDGGMYIKNKDIINKIKEN